MTENKFYAKSIGKIGNRKFETIQQHTDDVLYEFERLKSIYPDCNVGWELLKTACLYHDLGKMNSFFQLRISSGRKYDEEIPHGVISTLFLDSKELKEKFGEDKTKLLFSVIYYHHDRESLYREDIQYNINRDLRQNEESLFEKDLINQAEKFVYDKLDRVEVNSFQENKISRFLNDSDKSLLPEFIMLKGLLNRIDYAASAHIPVEIKNDFLEDSLANFMKNLSDKNKNNEEHPKWNPLQEYMRENQDKNIIAIAQTGMGKTEAGLWWIGNNKGFFTLPVRAAINAIYTRIKEDILFNEDIDRRLGLLHSETKGKYLELKETDEQIKNNINWNDYYTRTRQMSLPLTVCTLDQLFTSVFKYRGYEPKLATLSYSKIIIDEIQMYGPDIIGFLICGLKMVQELGGKFAILTATFPSFLRDLMKEQNLIFDMPASPFLNYKKIRHSLQLHRRELNSGFIKDKYDGNRVLVVCNTVKKCQEIYEELLEVLNLDKEILDSQNIIDRELNLFHAKFIQKDRNKMEKAILEFGKLYGKGEAMDKRKGIWITSSIAEASLDIDFDMIITELSDINGLFQRLGRCFRKREWLGTGYNCHVFDGGSETCSGVGGNIDRDIFELSKSELRKFFDKHGVKDGAQMDEETKVNLVESTYSTENVKDLNYYKSILECINEPDKYLVGEKNSQEAQQLFRNILSETIIPCDIYNNNKDEIDSLSITINDWDAKSDDRIKAKEKLKNFIIDVESYRLNGVKPIKVISLGKYEEILVIDAEYDTNIGLRKIVKEKTVYSDNFG